MAGILAGSETSARNAPTCSPHCYTPLFINFSTCVVYIKAFDWFLSRIAIDRACVGPTTRPLKPRTAHMFAKLADKYVYLRCVNIRASLWVAAADPLLPPTPTYPPFATPLHPQPPSAPPHRLHVPRSLPPSPFPSIPPPPLLRTRRSSFFLQSNMAAFRGGGVGRRREEGGREESRCLGLPFFRCPFSPPSYLVSY